MDDLIRLEDIRQSPIPESHIQSCDVNYTITNQTSLMSYPPPIIHTPQPRRPLKRSFWDSSPGEGNQESCVKRQRLHIFLDSIPEPLTRCRSDSYLPSTMSTRPERKRTRPVPFEEWSTPVTPRSQSARRSTSIRTVTTSTDTTGLPPPTRSDSRVSSITDSKGSSTKRTAQPWYREDLARNGILFLGSRHAPPEILQHARLTINKTRGSPGLSEEQADTVVDDLERLRHSGDEITLIKTLAAHQILPRSLDPNIEYGGDRPFSIKALPHVQGQPILAVPKPDQYYAYHYGAFTAEQSLAMNDPALSAYSKPATSGYFPFFTIEFKSTARMGSIWVAENQAATNGALCVNSMEHLFGLIEQDPKQIETITFSCLMDERAAAVWVTYCDRMKGQIINVEVEQYSMSRTSEVIGVRNAIKNICDWGLRERLPVVISALEQLKPTYLDKDLRARTSSVFSDQSSSKRQDRGSYDTSQTSINVSVTEASRGQTSDADGQSTIVLHKQPSTSHDEMQTTGSRSY